MSHKTIAKIALVMAFVFGAIVIVYPLMFSPDANQTEKVEVTPAPAVN